ncbi:glycosyltransferase family 2 protein [Natronomonas salina]|uniref:glucosyl-dolichyl phosphate glucuronosyltransferase n=1 Tax=Natronomonas salina TaxID=1710540 RepID=UPI0015B52D50|nr:glucosyl-dolichyl phosphate glucuronosyltransferase [Natronomonas salina]QLD90780.1 glycosyltransferase family 2 protein [Natronomonas salina]
MRVSVVLCEHSMERYDDFTEAANAVLSQTYDDVELVVVIDGNETVYERALEDFDDRNDVIVECNDENVGLLTSRNRGAELATGDVVAFIDDDAVPAGDWIELLVEGYEQRDALAVGGKMTPRWVAGKPSYLPAEFYWLVGVTQRGFADGPCEVRNTFGSNISFRRDVFLELGGFESDVGGRQGDANLQGGETELCARLQAEYGEGVWYIPDAEVEHKVFAYRTEVGWLLNRAFWQGYSKRGMEVFVDESTDEEFDFLGQLVTEFVPARTKELVDAPSIEKALQFVMMFVFTALVGFGYLYGLVKWRGQP